MHCFRQARRTAKGAFSVWGLAVLFLLIWSLAELWICGEAKAVGLKIELLEKDRELVLFGQPSTQVGLSISSDSVPLLKNNLKFTQKVVIDYDQGFVNISETLGGYQISKPIFLTVSNYTYTKNWLKTQESWRKNLTTYFKKGRAKSRGLFEWEIPFKPPKLVSKIIGEGGSGLKVSGHRKISFSGRSTWEEGVVNTATSRQSKFPSLNMEQESKFTITGTIGSKISVQVDQDSRRHTDLENTLRLRYTGEEDEIIKTIEAGNTNLSVRSGLIGYGEKVQGLFGIKTTAKIGGWDLTMITSQEKGSTQRAEFKAGAETHKQKIRDYDYLQRTFYFLGQDAKMNDGGHTHSIPYQYEFFLGDSIIDIKLFKSNQYINNPTAQNLSPFGIAYVDPENEDTLESYNEEPLFRRFEEIDPDDYFVSRTEYWIQLYQSLQPLDILAAYYVILREDGKVDTVGNIKDSCSTSEEDTCMKLRLIKPDTPSPKDFTWEYEWKNVYSLRAKNINKEDFKLDIYKGALNAENIQEDKNTQDSTLYLRIFGLDQLDLSGNPQPDGVVDYRQIDFGWGYLIFPQRYPFSADTLQEKVNSIYSSNNMNDRREESKYYIYVESASRKSNYLLGRAPIIEGSEVVTLNGRPLTKGQDYNIVYETGEITFLTPEALSPTANLTVDYEYAPLLMIEKKSLFGIQGEYSLGNLKFGTVGIYKSEKTAEEKPRVGQEPVRNFVWGSNLEYSSTSAPFITRMINALPLVKTDALSTFKFKGQIAQSIPNPNTKNKAFIDDFEGSLEYTDLSIRRGVWTLSSPPEGRECDARCKMWWYNPYDRVPITDIWPNKEVERTEDRTNILDLQLFPDKPHRPSDTLFASTEDSSRWNGIMRAFFAGAYDQTRTKFLEIWLNGNKGVLYVDLGEISEDIDADGNLDTEDKEKNGQRDGLLDDDEDTGLDGVFDPKEPGYSDTLTDPAGDNWNYDDRYDYSRINGTESNRDDPDRSRRPDTEDINSNSVLDVTNNYYQYRIDLSDPSNKFLADPGDNEGWRLYRIPLKEPGNYTEEGSPDWGDIRFARVWFSSSEPTKVQIASIQLVGNRWQNLGISSLDSLRRALRIGEPPAEKEEFDVFVINTHENPDYTPPPGVAGILNRQTQVREKEQSLVLKYTNLKPLHQGWAYRFLYNPEDYTNYRYLKMFVHGQEDPDSVEFFLKLGSDSTNFYEYHTRVSPGWEGNEVVIDFEKITALKAYALNSREPGSYEPIDTTAGHYRVKGKPSLSRVRWLSMGVKNVDSLGSEPVTGEIWVDELRVTDIRKEKGLAGNFRIDAKLADLCNLNFTFKKQDSEYRNLTTKKEGYSSSMSYQMNISGFQLHKFLPYSFGYSLPLSFSYSRSLTLPKWKTGSDILLPKELREKEKTESISKGISFSPSFTKPTKNWLLGLTLKRMSTSFSYRTSSNTSLNKPVNKSNNYRVNGGYNLSGIKEFSFAPLGWAKIPLLPKSLTQTKFSLLPTSLNFNGTVNRTKTHSVDNVGNVEEISKRDFNGNMKADASPIKGIPVTYTMRTSRDISDPQTVKFSFNPKKAKLGIERNFSETFKVSYNPHWFSFLDTRFSFDSKYSENSDFRDSENQGGTRSITNSNKRRANFTFNWQKFFGSGGQKGGKKKISLNPLKLLANLTKRIDPVAGSYQKSQNFSRSGLLERPSLTYRLGFTDDPKVETKGSFRSRDRISTEEGYTARSGIKLLGTKINSNYSKKVGRTQTSTGDTKSTSTTFPDFDFGWSN
ncbi:MAG: cell surface protein SprA, partial [candidate division Zixibacteria bacterium]|nr:cell surface protein SprA [candidate division Zixibacteria bacterium]